MRVWHVLFSSRTSWFCWTFLVAHIQNWSCRTVAINYVLVWGHSEWNPHEKDVYLFQTWCMFKYALEPKLCYQHTKCDENVIHLSCFIGFHEIYKQCTVPLYFFSIWLMLNVLSVLCLISDQYSGLLGYCTFSIMHCSKGLGLALSKEFNRVGVSHSLFLFYKIWLFVILAFSWL
jgi:hypothetical protein